MARILIVDDEPHMRRILVSNLQQDKHVLIQTTGVSEACGAVAAEQFDVVITDHKMGDGTGLDVLEFVRHSDPTLSVICLTAVGTIELAVESMRSGAFDFLTKPFVPEVLRAAVKRAAERTTLLRENERLKDAVERLDNPSEMVGTSAALALVREHVGRVARTAATVLITGETGTGKELVARAIHRQSPRAAKPFVAINCAAFTETLLESELFGHERGAFTGADRPRQGLFEAAHEGTLFLDEIGEMTMTAQARLLRVLMDGQVLRLGSTAPRKVDVRLIVATHRDLQQRVKDGLFREDLLYRISVVPITVPPLRERREDIPVLCDFFLKRASVELKVPLRSLSATARDALQNYSFPGNIRELRNLIERACILSPGYVIDTQAFPFAGNSSSKGGETAPATDTWIENLPDTLEVRALLETIEMSLIARALRRADGSQAEAARHLGLSRSDLAYKLAKYNMRTAGQKS